MDDQKRIYLEMRLYFPLPNSSPFNNYEDFHILFKVVKPLIWYNVVKYSKNRINEAYVHKSQTFFTNRNIAKSGISYDAY